MQKILLKLLAISVALMATSSMYGWYNTKKVRYSDAEIDNLFAPITTKYGIKIIYKIDENFLSPVEEGHRPGPGKNSRIEPIPNKILVQYPEILLKAFSKYPVQVITQHLKAIHLAKEIEDNGLHYGGSYDPYRHIIFLVNNGQQTENTAIAAFHHEFSSLLLKSRGFLLNPWKAQNPPDFKYLREQYSTWNEMRRVIDITRKPNHQDYDKGFVTVYGQTNFGNDFSEYAAMIFTHPKKFKQVMGQYPRIRKKFLVWLDFYQDIDPIFTEKYLFGAV